MIGPTGGISPNSVGDADEVGEWCGGLELSYRRSCVAW